MTRPTDEQVRRQDVERHGQKREHPVPVRQPNAPLFLSALPGKTGHFELAAIVYRPTVKDNRLAALGTTHAQFHLVCLLYAPMPADRLKFGKHFFPAAPRALVCQTRSLVPGFCFPYSSIHSSSFGSRRICTPTRRKPRSFRFSRKSRNRTGEHKAKMLYSAPCQSGHAALRSSIWTEWRTRFRCPRPRCTKPSRSGWHRFKGRSGWARSPKG